MRTLLCALILAACAFTAAADTNVTGTWTGSFVITGPGGESNSDTAWLILKQDGAEIAGTAGPNADEQFKITKGKIDGDKITLEVDHGGETIKLDLVLADDHIKGEANLPSDGQTLKAKIDLTRNKQ